MASTRAISVKTRRPGVQVRARKGYVALEPARLITPTPLTKSAEPPVTRPLLPVSLGLLALPEEGSVAIAVPAVAAGAAAKSTLPPSAGALDPSRALLTLGKGADSNVMAD